MPHTEAHCGGVGELMTDEPAEIQITIKNHTRLNYAVAMKRWPDESDNHWAKRKEKLSKLQHKIYALAAMAGDQFYYHAPSYVHEEPPHDH